ncbi:uncharacterized protein LOC102705941 [Oryza brachyantha]|uniref:uncharacterized protein LOC102705941 n=1 Tax=Oryza brachyantha TaxID=4533 RepID=UPI0003EA9560|nr:uncharacterized protein LOC102705941 [Oryza brachyantha]XP_015696569.1 uncharacterized protein LOC102705941 [Oryza brachyantha]
MAGPAATALPLSAGSPPLPRRDPSVVCGLTRAPRLMVAKAHTCVLLRFTPVSRWKCVAATGHGGQGLRAGQYQFDDDEPLWLAVVRDITWGLRSFVAFLAEQPRQLKHLEWPGFRNTLRTATLTLLLVAVFIVVLSSVDAALCYVLSWLLRKSA